LYIGVREFYVYPSKRGEARCGILVGFYAIASSPLEAGLISSIFRVKKSNSNPNLKIKFKPKRPKYGRNHGFEFDFCVLNLNFKTIKTKNYIELINPAFGGAGGGLPPKLYFQII
jgi:hypothetical protein